MATAPKWVQRAMNKAISRVRFEHAAIRLPGTSFPDTDTDTVREATQLYVETWIVPLLEAVRDNNQPTGECLS